MDDTTTISAETCAASRNESVAVEECAHAMFKLLRPLSDVASGVWTLTRVIELLGADLANADDPFARAKATGTLAAIVESSPEAVDTSQFRVLSRFFCERLRDQPSVAECLRGVLALTKCVAPFKDPAVGGQCAADVVQACLAELNVQSFVQTTRMLFFRVLTALLGVHLAAVKGAMPERDFIRGFIAAIDGEKDPRNLLMAFRLVRVVALHFDIKDQAEELFEVSACYFPITFRPPPGDPYGIDAEDLKCELKLCMTASAHFTPYAIPLLMEKLASASSAARRDALDVLAEGLPVYGVLSLPRSASPKQNVWKLVSDTLFEREDDSEEAALRFVTAYVRGLSGVQYASEEARQANLLAQWVHAVLDDVKQYWTSDEVSLRSRVTARLLVAMAKASAQSAKVVVDYVLPSWTQRYHEKTAQKKFFLDGMQTLVAACAEGAAVNQSTERHCMAAYNDEVMEIVTSALGDAGLGSVALGVLAEILLQPGLLDEDETNLAMENLAHQLLAPNAPNRIAAITCLKRYVDSHPNSQAALAIIGQLGGRTKAAYDAGRGVDGEAFERDMDTLVRLAENERLMFEIFGLLCSFKERLEGIDMILDSITTIATYAKFTAEPVNIENLRTFTLHLVSAAASETSRLAMGKAIFDKLAGICALMMQAVDAEQQRVIACMTVDMFFRGNRGAFGGALTPTDASLMPVATPWQRDLLPIFSALLCNLRREVTLDKTHDFVCHLLHWNVGASSDANTDVAKVLASFANKAASGSTGETLVDDVVSSIKGDLSETTLLHTIWIAKALVIRGHAKGYELTDRLMDCLQQEDLTARCAADGFAVIMGEGDGALGKQNFAQQRVLYRQRFFTECIPKLERRFREVDDAHKRYFLIALSHILRNAPQKILLGQLLSLLPLLFHSLLFDDVTLKMNTLQTLQLVLRESPLSLQTHANTLVKSLLGMTTPPTPMAIRIAALQCLTEVPKLPFDILFPHRAVVTRTLAAPLADPKRLVRKQAVICRNKWYLLVGE